MSAAKNGLTHLDLADPGTVDHLLPLVYNELRKLAAARLAQEKSGYTLQATTLLHEAYLRLVGGGPVQWESRGHFFAAAAEAMRRIMIERARAKATKKRGAGAISLDLNDVDLPARERTSELLRLDEALTLLEQHDEQAARLVKLRYFAGLSHQEAAAALGISRAAADRQWKLARAWLFKQVSD